MDQLESGSAAYTISAAFRLTGSLNTLALEQSLNEIVRRHEALRTTFAARDGRPIQMIAPTLALTLTINDLTHLPRLEQKAKLEQLAVEQVQRPFNLAQGPLLRVVLLKLGEEEHSLILTMPHIVSDGWSMGVLNRELAALYTAFSAGQPSPLVELPIQYADYVCWQREWLQGEALDSQLAYWKQQLGGSLPVLELPTDRPRPAVQTFRGATHSFILPVALTESLQALSRREGATLFMTLLAAFKTLLYRYTGRENIVVGIPIANRNRPEVEELIGFFVNTLVLRTDLAGEPTFRELLGRVREVTLGAFAHQDLPFEKLVEVLHPERDMSRNPLFQVMFAFQNTPMEPLILPGLAVSPVEIDSKTAQFDLTLFLEETGQGLKGMVEYNTDLFDATTIERMVKHYQVLLEGVVDNPEQRLWQLPLLTEAERRQILVTWNNTAVEYPHAARKCIHELFEAQVERTPDAVAVVFEDQHVTYRELNRRANQLAHYLQKRGVGPETLVGICVERSLEMVVGLYGILKAGGAYVPLDPTYPPERLIFMMADTQAPVLLTQKKPASVFTDQPHLNRPPRLICLDSDWENIARHTDQNSVSRVTGDNLVYVIYTSGSTGQPKGAMNTHAAIRNRLLWMQQAYCLTETDRVMQKTPFSFDVSVWEFFWPLLNGACLVVAQPEGHKDSAYLVRLVIEQNVTTMHFVPPMLQVFVEEQGVDRCKSLKRVICSGEALPFDLQQRFFARLGAELHNLYGPTEASVDVTFWPCQRECQWRFVPIGRPIANIRIYLLDRHLQPVPVGVPGELHIGGVGLGRGYCNRPELTADKFTPHPFEDSQAPGARLPGAAATGSRLYRTGDLARYLPDGNIEFLGRIDHQVKLRGFRIELGEIEAVLGQHPAVQHAVMLVREDQPGDKRLVAYLVPTKGQTPTTDNLRRFLQDKLPEYMIPSAFVTLLALPLTPNGKVNRKALPAPDTNRPEIGREFVAPRTPVEEVLAGIWAGVLGLEQVGVYDNFFDLGGHSLLATQVISRVRETFMVELPLRTFFEAPVVAKLSRSIIANEARPGQAEKIARVLKMVESLSAEEAKEMLQTKKKGMSNEAND